ncbi:hypothetical protein GQ600_27148 [Phytophthora cactorum]|nr:hypothetical protein GQ600_27148 [Phytophthora cactorum]
MQLAGPGIIVAKDQDAAHLEGLARPFASYKEMRTSAAKRLQLQRQPEEEAQAEMTPAAKSMSVEQPARQRQQPSTRRT